MRIFNFTADDNKYFLEYQNPLQTRQNIIKRTVTRYCNKSATIIQKIKAINHKLDAIINFWTLKNQHPLHMSQQGTFFIDKYIKYKCHIRMSTALASLSLLRQKHNTVTHACFLCYLQSRMITFFEYYLITAITIWPKVWINLTEYL